MLFYLLTTDSHTCEENVDERPKSVSLQSHSTVLSIRQISSVLRWQISQNFLRFYNTCQSAEANHPAAALPELEIGNVSLFFAWLVAPVKTNHEVEGTDVCRLPGALASSACKGGIPCSFFFYFQMPAHLSQPSVILLGLDVLEETPLLWSCEHEYIVLREPSE